MQPGRRQRAAGTSSRSQPGQGEEQPSPCLGPDVYFESCLLSFHVFREVLSASSAPVLSLLEEVGLLGSKETAPRVSLLCLPVTGSCFEIMAADGSAGGGCRGPSFP